MPYYAVRRGFNPDDDEEDDYSEDESVVNEDYPLNCQASYLLEFDGASRSNGSDNQDAGAGAVLYCWDGFEWSWTGNLCFSLGSATNNQAEYAALILGLEAAYDAGVRRIEVKGDSRLVVKQVEGNWKISNRLWPLYERASRISEDFDEFSISWHKRSSNTEADELANQAIDEGGWSGMLDDQDRVLAYWRDDDLPILE